MNLVHPMTGSRRPHGRSPHGLWAGVASDASALGYAPPMNLVDPMTGSRRPHGRSPHGLWAGVASDASALGYVPSNVVDSIDGFETAARAKPARPLGRRRKRRLSTWLRPIERRRLNRRVWYGRTGEARTAF